MWGGSSDSSTLSGPIDSLPKRLREQSAKLLSVDSTSTRVSNKTSEENVNELSPCPKCLCKGAQIEKEIWYKGDYDDSCLHKFIAKCPYCGFEMRRNGKKHRKDLVSSWNALYDKNFMKAT